MKFIIFIYEKLAQKNTGATVLPAGFWFGNDIKKRRGKTPPRKVNASIFDFVVDAHKVHFKEVRQNCFE